jgi:hypothetical protein
VSYLPCPVEPRISSTEVGISVSDIWDDSSSQRTEDKIPRDRWSRPLVVPPNGGKPVAYTRVTTFAGAVEDMFGLGQWQQRMVALGLAKRADLLLAVSAHSEDRDELNRITDQAKEAAAASAAATTGTALHKLAERYDRGELKLADVPESHRADLAAYVTAMAPLTIHGIEKFVVVDELKVAGTFDRIVEYDGQRYVADIKTGSLDYGVGKMAVQLSLYSRGWFAWPGKPDRGVTGVSTSAGLIVHLPAGKGQCHLHWIDLKAGWYGAELCEMVREWRKRKGLLAAAEFAAASPVVELTESFAATTLTIEAQIANAESRDELERLWFDNQHAWTAQHTRLAGQRKTALHQQVLRDAVRAS